MSLRILFSVLVLIDNVNLIFRFSTDFKTLSILLGFIIFSTFSRILVFQRFNQIFQLIVHFLSSNLNAPLIVSFLHLFFRVKTVVPWVYLLPSRYSWNVQTISADEYIITLVDSSLLFWSEFKEIIRILIYYRFLILILKNSDNISCFIFVVYMTKRDVFFGWC